MALGGGLGSMLQLSTSGRRSYLLGTVERGTFLSAQLLVNTRHLSFKGTPSNGDDHPQSRGCCVYFHNSRIHCNEARSLRARRNLLSQCDERVGIRSLNRLSNRLQAFRVVWPLTTQRSLR